MEQRIETSLVGASVSLFHGQGAQDAAMEAAGQYGRILAVLGGEKGLRKDDSREMLRLHNMPPASDAFGSVVLGPMDLATFEAADALLKIIEEPSHYTRPFLWAFDLGEVPMPSRLVLWRVLHLRRNRPKANRRSLGGKRDHHWGVDAKARPQNRLGCRLGPSLKTRVRASHVVAHEECPWA